MTGTLDRRLRGSRSAFIGTSTGRLALDRCRPEPVW